MMKIAKQSSKTRFNFLYRAFGFFAFGFIMSATFSSNAQVKISAKIDSTTILIGDQIHLQLTATCNPQNFHVQFPSVPDTFNHFELVSKSKVDTLTGRDETTYKQTVIITNFDSGQWKIPSMPFDIQSLKGDTPSTLMTDSFLINVNTIAVDTAKPIKPIFGIRSAKMPIKEILLYALALVALLALIGLLIWYLIKRSRARKKVVPAEPEITLLPHEKALRDLQRIEQEKLWQSGQEKQYHTELTDVIRTYLDEQFHIDCFEKTSTEIIHQVKKIKALSTSRQPLRTIFETSDLVKFAKSHPTPDEHIQSMELAKAFILEAYKRVKPIETNNEQINNTIS